MKIEPIGYIRTPFKEKFGIPRQALSNINGQCKLEMTGAYSHPSFYKGLESFSHLWIHYYLDKAVWKGQTTLRPPRLGGEKKMGLFATRGPHRPNPIGQSLVQLNKIEFNTQSTVLHTSLIDAIDNTPVLDIKPYISNYDMASEAKSGWVNETSFPSLKIDFSNNVILSLKRRFPNPEQYHRVFDLINSILKQDPRPAYHRNKSHTRAYGIKLYDFDLHFSYQNEQILVEDIK